MKGGFLDRLTERHDKSKHQLEVEYLPSRQNVQKASEQILARKRI